MDDIQDKRMRAMRKMLISQLGEIDPKSPRSALKSTEILDVLGYNQRMIGKYLLGECGFEDGELVEFPKAKDDCITLLVPKFRVGQTVQVVSGPSREGGQPDVFDVSVIEYYVDPADRKASWMYWGSTGMNRITLFGGYFEDQLKLVK